MLFILTQKKKIRRQFLTLFELSRSLDETSPLAQVVDIGRPQRPVFICLIGGLKGDPCFSMPLYIFAETD